MSNAGLGRAVVTAGAKEGMHLGTGTTSVKRDFLTRTRRQQDNDL